jgi:hypothetical protein
MFYVDSEVGDILIIRGVLFIPSKVHFPCLYFVNICVFGLKQLVTTSLRIFLMLTEIFISYLSLYIILYYCRCMLCLASVYSLTFGVFSVQYTIVSRRLLYSGRGGGLSVARWP